MRQEILMQSFLSYAIHSIDFRAVMQTVKTL